MSERRDRMTPEQRSYCMSRIRSKDTSIEVAVRSGLHALGCRFNKHYAKLPGKPDIAFPGKRLAVFVDGDFWHGYRYGEWRHTLSPFWSGKIDRNIERDRDNRFKIRKSGWKVMRIWEHQIKGDLQGCLSAILKGLEAQEARTPRPRSSRGRPPLSRPADPGA